VPDQRCEPVIAVIERVGVLLDAPTLDPDALVVLLADLDYACGPLSLSPAPGAEAQQDLVVHSLTHLHRALRLLGDLDHAVREARAAGFRSELAQAVPHLVPPVRKAVHHAAAAVYTFRRKLWEVDRG
jgi:hypothetical protein